MTKHMLVFNELTEKLHKQNVPFMAWTIEDDKGHIDIQLSPYHLKFFIRHLLVSRPEIMPLINIVMLEQQIATILEQRGEIAPENNKLVV